MAIPLRSGTEIIVAQQISNVQSAPSLAALADGRIVVTWADAGSTNGDIKMRVLNANGFGVGNEVTINTVTTGSQSLPQVVALTGRGFAVVWEDFSANDGGDIRGRVFDVNGVALTNTDVLFQGGALAQREPQIVDTASGGFIIGWWDGNTATTGLPSSSAAMAREYTSSGAAVGTFPTRMSGSWGGDFAPVMARSGNTIAVSWDDDLGPTIPLNGEDGIYFREFSGALPQPAGLGLASFADGGTRVDSGTFRESSRLPDIAYVNLGPIVVWEDSIANVTDGQDIYVRYLPSISNPGGGVPVRINTTTTGDQVAPAVASLVGGGCVFVWADFSNVANGADIRARVFDAVGNPTSDDFIVTTGAFTPGVQLDADVVGLIDGRFMVTWATGSDNARGIEIQIFDPRTAAVTWTGQAFGEQYHGTIFGDDLSGGGGDDSLVGGDGGDRILGQSGTDSLFGDLGNDSLYGGDNNDFAIGGIGQDYLDGQGENDALYGGDNNDTVVGNIGDDYLDGQGENDELYGNDGRDIMVGNLGNDYLDGGDGRDELYGNDNNDVLVGNLGDDYLDGQGEMDTLYGSQGNDTLFGNVGNDQLWGGIGADSLIGGLGDDQFRFALGDLQAGVRDVIADFAEAGGNADLLVFFGVAGGAVTTAASGGGTLVSIAIPGGAAEILVQGFTPAQLADQMFYL